MSSFEPKNNFQPEFKLAQDAKKTEWFYYVFQCRESSEIEVVNAPILYQERATKSLNLAAIGVRKSQIRLVDGDPLQATCMKCGNRPRLHRKDVGVYFDKISAKQEAEARNGRFPKVI